MKYILIIINLFYFITAFSQEKNEFTKFYYPNGKISSEGYMNNNKPNGYWKTYYPTGVIKSEGNRKNFLLDSIWLFFSETGDTLEKITYMNGKKNGYYYKFKKENEKNNTILNYIVSKELYVNDLKEGTGYYYYSNGKIKQTIVYKSNKKHGESREYDREGKLITLNIYFNDYLTEKQNINRLQNNIPVGVWREYYSNGKLKSEKNYKNGELDGYSNEYSENGKLVNHQLFNEGKLVNIGKEDTLDINEVIEYYDNKKVKKRSYFKNGIPVGIHRDFDANGNVIGSKIYDNYGNLTGEGIINEDGTRQGRFKWYYNNGPLKSEGEYINNRQNGKWLFYFESTAIQQIGSFNNGYFNGQWKWFYPDSTVLRIENYTNGKRNGLYVEFNKNGDTIVRGNYKDDLKEGSWYCNYGDVYEIGNYTNDLKEGLWKSYYSNGSVFSKGIFIDGNPDGKFLFYYENNVIKEEQYYVNGIREKIWKKYNNDGILFISVLYQNNMEMRVNGVKLAILK